MVRLLNSAVVVKSGKYNAMRISEQEAKEIFEKHKGSGWKSYIGYKETAEYVKDVLGIEIELSREETELNDNDIMLVCRLKYRVKDPSQKGQLQPTREDFEWWLITYEE